MQSGNPDVDIGLDLSLLRKLEVTVGRKNMARHGHLPL